MSEEDRVVARENGGERVRGDGARRLDVPAAPRRARRAGVRLVLQRRLRTRRSGSCSTTSGISRTRRTSTTAMHHAWIEGYVAGEPRVRRRGRRRARSRPERGGLLPRLPPLCRAALRARRAAGRAARALRAHPVAADGLLVRCCRSTIRRAVHDGLLANDAIGFHTRRWRRNFMRVGGGHRRRELPDWARDALGYEGRRVAVTAAPISVDPSEFDELAQSPSRCSRPARVLARAPAGEGDPPRRPHRSVEEHRARLSRVRALPRRASGDARARRPARAARPVAAGHSRVRRVRRRDPARGAARQRPLPAGRLDADRPADERQLPAGGRRVQGLRRAARQRDLRRAEPRREGGAARQRARRRAHPLGERGRARGARRLGADGQSVRRRRPGRGDPSRARDARRRAARAARGDPRPGCASTTSRRGSRCSSQVARRGATSSLAV